MDICVLCPRCGVEKPLRGFGKNRARKTGRQTYCMACCSAYAREYRKWSPEPPDRYAKQKRQFAAKAAVARAVKSGKLIRPPVCLVCQTGERPVEAHHWLGYARKNWLKVRWMCRSCHQALHHNER